MDHGSAESVLKYVVSLNPTGSSSMYRLSWKRPVVGKYGGGVITAQWSYEYRFEYPVPLDGSRKPRRSPDAAAHVCSRRK